MHVPPELSALAGTKALLSNVGMQGRLFQLNDMTFKIHVVENSNLNREEFHGFVILREYKWSTQPRNEPVVRGVRVNLDAHKLLLDDLWVEHGHLEFWQASYGPQIKHTPLLQKKPWKIRGADDYLSLQEYESFVQQLASELRPTLAAAAKARIDARKAELAAANAVEEAAATAHFKANVRREDLGEDNGAWGMF